jgi:hypothetical protein
MFVEKVGQGGAGDTESDSGLHRQPKRLDDLRLHKPAWVGGVLHADAFDRGGHALNLLVVSEPSSIAGHFFCPLRFARLFQDCVLETFNELDLRPAFALPRCDQGRIPYKPLPDIPGDDIRRRNTAVSGQLAIIGCRPSRVRSNVVPLRGAPPTTTIDRQAERRTRQRRC